MAHPSSDEHDAFIQERFRLHHEALKTGVNVKPPKDPGEIYFFFSGELDRPQMLQQALSLPTMPTPYKATVPGIGLKNHGQRRVMTPLFGEQKVRTAPLTGFAYPGISDYSSQILHMFAGEEKGWFVDVAWAYLQQPNGGSKKVMAWLCVHLE